MDILPTTFRKDDQLGARHVNALARVANRSQEFLNKYTEGRFFQRRLKVSEVALNVNDPGWRCDAAKYLVIPMYFDHATKIWTNTEEEALCMDGSDIAPNLIAGDICIGYWDEQRGMYVALTNKIADDSGSSGGTDLCCCDELNCLRIPGIPASTVLTPDYLEFTPNTLVCGCTPVEDAKKTVQLYDVDPVNHLIWEQKHGTDDHPFQCLVPAGSTAPCTVTATYKWVAAITNPCAGTCSWSAFATSPGSPSTTYLWKDPVFNCTGDCLGCGNPPNSTPPTSLSDTITTPCVSNSPTPHWELQGVDDVDCHCTPVQPDYSGTVIGQIATTTCTGTKVVTGSASVLRVAFWRLTIVKDLNYVGCDDTVLQFIIGTTVVLTYYLKRPCGNIRQFCLECTNSFNISSPCKPICTSGPSTICLVPRIPNYYGSGSGWCFAGTVSTNLFDGQDLTIQVLKRLAVTINTTAPDLTCALHGGGSTIFAGDGKYVSDTYVCYLTNLDTVPPTENPVTYDGVPGTTIHYKWAGNNGKYQVIIIIGINTGGGCSVAIEIDSLFSFHPLCAGESFSDPTRTPAASPVAFASGLFDQFWWTVPGMTGPRTGFTGNFWDYIAPFSQISDTANPATNVPMYITIRPNLIT